MDIRSLNNHYGIEEALVFSEHPSGLVCAKIQTSDCTGEFFLQGAHVTQYRDLLFMSAESLYVQGKPIRGGIPICFPWFSSHPLDTNLPAHGWARTSLWQVLRTDRVDGAIQVELGLSKDKWELVYRIEMGSILKVALVATNMSDTPCDFEVALHTYFRVGDIDGVRITGDLDHCGYYDQLTKTDHAKTQSSIGFNQETDRIYYGCAPKITIQDTSMDRSIEIESQGSEATVVWNPWIEKSKRMPDFGDSEYVHMCCIETANVRRRSVRLDPHESHTTGVQIWSRSL